MRMALLAAVLLLLQVSADPIDVAHDFLWAAGSADGAMLAGLLSRDLTARLDDVFQQMSLLAAQNPDMLSAALARFDGRISPEEVTSLSRDELLGRLLQGRSFPGSHEVTRENAVLEGRNATVVLDFEGGGTVSFRMVWEDSQWKVADTSVLRMIF